MPRLMLAFLFCLLAGVAIWFALRHAPAPAPMPTEHESASPVAPASSSPTPVSDRAADANAAPAAAPASQRTSAAADAPTTTPTVVYEVLVVDAANAPSANAEIAVDDRTHGERLHANDVLDRSVLRNDGEVLARRFGRVVRTDAAGVAFVPAGDRGASLHARAGANYGVLHLDKNAHPTLHRHRLTVRPDRTLHVRVLDAAGTPTAGAAVVLTQHGDDGVFLRKWRPAHTTFSVAPDGIATFPHMQDWQHVESDLRRPLRSWRVRLDLPGHDDPGVAFDPQAPPAEPIELRLPSATGTLAVRLVVAGLPVRVTSEYWLYAGDARSQQARNDACRAVADSDGYARFRFVALQQSFVAGVWHGGPLEQTCAGPIAANQEVKFDLSPGPEDVVLTGTFVDATGRPLAAGANVVALYEFGISRRVAVVHAGDGGRFAWLVGSSPNGLGSLRSAAFSHESSDGEQLRHQLREPAFGAGVHDLGVVPLVRGARVVAGKFTTASGGPVRQVGFSIERNVPNTGSRAGSPWQFVEGLSVQQPGDGRFEVTGDVPAGRYRMQFPTSDHLPIDPIEFDAGADGLVVPIDFGGELRASVRLPPDCPQGVLGVVRGPGPPPEERVVHVSRTGEPGRAELQWCAVPAGSYTIELRIYGFADPLHVIGDVVVPQPDGGDPRLVDIDLRERVGVATLRVEAGQVAPSDDKLLVVPQPPIDATAPLAFEFRGSVARIPIPLPSARVLVARAGLRPKVLDALSAGETVLTFDAWEAVDVTIDVPALPPGMQLRATLANDPAQRRRYARMMGGAVASLAITDAPDLPVNVVDGQVRLPIGTSPRALRIWLHGASDTRGQLLAHDTTTVSPGQTNVAVRITADELARAVKALR